VEDAAGRHCLLTIDLARRTAHAWAGPELAGGTPFACKVVDAPGEVLEDAWVLVGYRGETEDWLSVWHGGPRWTIKRFPSARPASAAGS